ncbi:MAG TPA: hypothetical protein VGB73_04790 [Pyrinomonadaceae bacterium]|jgi:hypothetical protein
MAARLEVKTVLETSYTLAGRRLSFEADDEWAALVVQTYLNGFQLKLSESGLSPAPDFRVRLLAEDPPPVPPSLQKFDLAPEGHCFTDGERYYLDIDDSHIAVGTRSSREMSVWLGRTPHARRPLSLVSVMSCALHIALRRCALYDLHAAGLVEPETGAGVLFLGDSNSGKTSLTLRLTRSGWSYLSDDLLVFYEGAEAIEARGLRRVFSVSASNLVNCDLPRIEEALGVPGLRDPNKRRLEPSVVFPERLAESCVPRALYFASITGERKSRIEEVGQSDALIRLVRLCPWASFDVMARENLRVLSRLVRQTKIYNLLAGRDVFDDPDCAAALFASRAAAA